MKCKKIIAVLLTVVLTLCAFSTIAYASDVPNDQPDEFFEFILPDPLKRVNANGDFTFKFENALVSTLFKPVRTSVTISCITSTDSGAWFTVALYDIQDNKIGSFTAKDNGKEYSKTFNGLSTSTDYYFRLDKVNWTNDAVVEGTGHVTNLY